MHGVGDLVMCLSDFNGHIDGFDGFMERIRIGQ